MTHARKHHHVDYAVVGSGIAGLRAAIELSTGGSVLVLAKSSLSETATAWAQTGVAVALSDEEEIGLHEQDTLACGDGLCRAEAVAAMVEEGPKYIAELLEWSAGKSGKSGTKLSFTRETANSRSRILHGEGESTGKEIGKALLAKAHQIPHLHLRAHSFTTELMVERGRVTGLRFLDETDGSEHELQAGAVLLASGGAGQIFQETTNPEVATGDGVAIAHDAGAVLEDMEFLQFHPTALAVKGAPRFLLSDALRHEGGVLRNIGLERFMKHYHDAQEVAPREIVARAILSEMQKTRSTHVYLDLTKKSEEVLKKRFARIYETCAAYGLDLARDMVPACPAAHYLMGGVKTDLWGRTSLPGLYAAGETAATGVHGANRMAGNALLEGLVFGARAGQAMKKDAPAVRKSGGALPGSLAPLANSVEAAEQKAGAKAKPKNSGVWEAREKLRQVMWQEAGLMRNGKGLAEALKQLEELGLSKTEKSGREGYELRNMRTVATLMVRMALAREESRGSHYREDHPYRDDEKFQKHSMAQKGTEVRFGDLQIGARANTGAR